MSHRPSAATYDYTLEVTHSNKQPREQQHSYACLWRYAKNKPVSDANPHPMEYIQQTNFRDHPYKTANSSFEKHSVPIDPQQLSEEQLKNGWSAGPHYLWSFIKTLRDDYYEANLDSPDEIPLRIDLNIPTNTQQNVPEYYEIYIVDSEGGEYAMWNGTELYANNRTHNELICKILTTVGNVYETPQLISEQLTRVQHRQQ